MRLPPSPRHQLPCSQLLGRSRSPKLGLSGWYGPECKKWLGPNTASSSVPDYLTGEYPGDYGWDSARPAADPKSIERLRKVEVLHDRWAMLGTLWCLTRELLRQYTAIDNGASKGVWFKAAVVIFEFYGLNYMGAPALVRAQSILAVLACQLVLMGAIEAYCVIGDPFGGRDLALVCPSGK